eukprot:3937957-Alexandrium_andersonii.AAC.1
MDADEGQMRRSADVVADIRLAQAPAQASAPAAGGGDVEVVDLVGHSQEEPPSAAPAAGAGDAALTVPEEEMAPDAGDVPAVGGAGSR